MRRVIWTAFVVLSTLAILVLLWQFSISIVLFFLSLAVAAAIRPLIEHFHARGLTRSAALGLSYTLVIVFFAVLIVLVTPPLLEDAQKIADDFASSYERIKFSWPRSGTRTQAALAEALPPPDDLYSVLASEQGATALAGVLGIAQNVFTVLGRIAIIIILSLYWSADQQRFELLGLSLLPRSYHPRARKIWRSVEAGVGAYVRSELVKSLLAGIILGLGYAVFGVRYPVMLALWVALARLIPWFGAMIAVLPPLLVGIGTSPGLGLVVTLYTIGVLLVMALVIEPRVFHRKRYNALLIVIFVVALAEIFGLVGVILAPPLAVAVQIFFERLMPSPAGAFYREIFDQGVDLKRRVRKLEKSARRRKMAPKETLQRLEEMRSLAGEIVAYADRR